MKVRPRAWDGTPRAPSPGEDAGPPQTEKGLCVVYKARRRGGCGPGGGRLVLPGLSAPRLPLTLPVLVPAALSGSRAEKTVHRVNAKTR